MTSQWYHITAHEILQLAPTPFFSKAARENLIGERESLVRRLTDNLPSASATQEPDINLLVSAAWWESPSVPARQQRAFRTPRWLDCDPLPDSSQCHILCGQWSHEQSPTADSHCRTKVHQIETVVLPQGHGRPVCMCAHAQVDWCGGWGNYAYIHNMLPSSAVLHMKK